MFTSRANTVSLLALTMSVYVCLLATANPQALAQRSSTIAAAHSQLRKVALATQSTTQLAQSEATVLEFSDKSVKLAVRDALKLGASTLSPETFCALLSKYLSLS
jgi:5,10-methylenetetrahydrofolate reductase